MAVSADIANVEDGSFGEPGTSGAEDRGSRSLVRPFHAARWLRGRHEQTIVPALIRRPPRHVTTRERMRLRDGDFLDLDWAVPDGTPQGVVVLVHGLEGSSRSPYILGCADRALRRGLVAVAMNHRGCSGEPNLLLRSYHAGDTDDLRDVIDWCGRRWPDLPAAIIGFSLGANISVKLFGEEPERPLPDLLRCGVAVSVPFSLDAVVAQLDRPSYAFYRAYFLKTLIPKALEKARRFPGSLDLAAIRRAAFRVREFDHCVTSPIHGFRSAEDYYERSSCAAYVRGVRRPLLMLSAVDDPLIPGSTIPFDELARHPHVRLVVTRRGGHCGFVAGSPLRPRFWAEEQAIIWIGRTFAGR